MSEDEPPSVQTGMRVPEVPLQLMFLKLCKNPINVGKSFYDSLYICLGSVRFFLFFDRKKLYFRKDIFNSSLPLQECISLK